MDIDALQKRFTLPKLISFEQFQGLTRLQVHTPQARATIYLQGAHLTAWQPSGAQPVIFVSRQSDFAPGKAIRGGIPVVFPWFATDQKKDRVAGHPGPSHGFARLQEWELREVNAAGDDLHLTLSFGPTEMSRSMGFDHFQLTMEFKIGHTLAVRLKVENLDQKPLTFEDAFHSYYAVLDVHEVTLTGLENTSYIDKTDGFKVKPAAEAPLIPSQAIDRIYNGTHATCRLHDKPEGRIISIQKSGSNSTVVFNPWKAMPDLGEWEWHEFLAVETANVGSDSITLQPGQQHVLGLDVSLSTP